MKRIRLLLSVATIAFIGNLHAQITQVELFSGFDKTDFTLFSSQPLNINPALSINTLAFFQKFRHEENHGFDELGVLPTLFWNFHKKIAVGASLYYNSFAGYSKRLSVMYSLKNSRWLLVVIPTVAHSEQKHIFQGESFVQFQFRSSLNDKISIWLNGQFLTVWDEFKSHSRSFQQLRAGVSFYTHQFGVGVDFDQYGPNLIKKSSFGMYYRKSI
ncbi:hypothetical protein [Zobellia sp. B3R18]|uniref:hypothetical protein n=1 Tax=Zobellia sp. B3R18 TaxID=2841568 RepID=UPI001C066619|nr:hypothetical protein [Zobellia sp. B3R18]MBU2973247.1 hypothetical protein [Zobellia sp. B3R18]